MKRIPIIILVFICTIGANAQNNSSALKIGVSTSFEKNTSSKNIAFDEYTGYFAEYNKANYKFGLNVEYKFKENLSINTAINYSNKDFTGTYYCMVCSFIVAPSPQEIEFRFVEVPVTLKYYFLPNKFRLFGEAGFNNFFLLNKEVTDNLYVLGIKLGAGFEYSLTEKTAFQIAIDYNNGITNLYKESNFKINSFAIGISILKRL